MGTTRLFSFEAINITLSVILFSLLTLTAPAHQTQTKDAEFEQAMANAESLHSQRKFDDEIKELERAAKLKDGRCADCFHRIGQVNVTRHRLNDAVVAFRHAIELDPDLEAEVSREIGATLFQQNDQTKYQEAEQYLRRSIELNTSRMEIAYFYLGSVLLKLGRDDEGRAALKECMRISPNSGYASSARNIIAGPRAPARPKLANGSAAINFNETSAAGDQVTIEKYRGKIILLDFWATWCGPCRAELPNIKGIWEKHKSDRFVIIGVSLDVDPRQFDSYVAKEHLTWPQYFDGMEWENKIVRLYQVSAIPSAIVIDQNGVVHSIGLRGKQLAAEIDNLLKKLPAAPNN